MSTTQNERLISFILPTAGMVKVWAFVTCFLNLEQLILCHCIQLHLSVQNIPRLLKYIEEFTTSSKTKRFIVIDFIGLLFRIPCSKTIYTQTLCDEIIHKTASTISVNFGDFGMIKMRIRKSERTNNELQMSLKTGNSFSAKKKLFNF